MQKQKKIILVIQARVNSSRLPRKILKKLGDTTVLGFLLERLKELKLVNELWIATTKSKNDDIIEKKFKNIANIYRGDENDVLERFYQLALISKPEIIIRITADCPFIDASLINKALEEFLYNKVDYLSNVLHRTYPDGLDFEIFNFKTLKISAEKCKDIVLREHVTPYMKTGYYKNFQTGNFKTYSFKNDVDFSHFRLTLDTMADYLFLKKIAKNLGNKFKWIEVISYLTLNHNLLSSQFLTKRKGALLDYSNNKDNSLKKYKFNKSNKYFIKAENIIPLATQTFSKSYQQYTKGAAPLFASRGKGAYLYDIDNNSYIDYVMGLLPIILGYCDEDVNQSITNQLQDGITFSLASRLEYKLALKLKKIIPCAEMVRFGKNGSDATTAAIRLARYYTGRKKILIAGYHGWHDWYIGSTTRDKGVPLEVKKLTDKIRPYNNKELEKKLRDSEYAAFIIEPYAQNADEKKYLREARKLTKKYNTLLIFDEIISGFRINLGGAQKEYDIKPDIATFGKSIANGMPLSIIAGKKKIMKGMKDIFFSTTFGGETLSLAAALSTIEKLEKRKVNKKIKIYGTRLINGLNNVIVSNNLTNYMSFSGPDWWPKFNIKNIKLETNLFKSLLRQELNANGLLINSALNISYSHCNEDIYNETIKRYNQALKALKTILSKDNPKSELKGELIKPVFEVRN